MQPNLKMYPMSQRLYFIMMLLKETTLIRDFSIIYFSTNVCWAK